MNPLFAVFGSFMRFDVVGGGLLWLLGFMSLLAVGFRVSSSGLRLGVWLGAWVWLVGLGIVGMGGWRLYLRVRRRLLIGWWSSVGTGLRVLELRMLRLGGKSLQANLKDLTYATAIN